MNAGAGLLVFPEYGSMELASIGGKASDVQASFDVVSGLVPELDRVHGGACGETWGDDCCGLGPAAPAGLHDECGAYLRAHGDQGHYDKIMPTPWEREPVEHCFGQDAHGV